MSSQERAHTSVNGEAEAAATPSILGSLASASTQQVQPTPAPAYPNVGQSQNAAIMMTNAAAAIAAVAATMQQFSQQQQQQLQHYHQPLQHHQQQSNAPAPPPPGQNSSMAASPAALLAALQQAQQLPAAALQPDPSATAAHNHLAALAANPAVLLAALGHVQPQSAMAVAHPHHAASAHAAAAHAAAGHYHHHPHASGASSRLLNATTTAADAVTAMSCRPTNGVTASSAAATVGAAQVPVNSAMLSEMQSWKLEQLEQHVTLLHQMNQPIPQSVALLLTEAQRKEKKKNAKRVANRKSASTSRARKKALVDEMTRVNARLKRQAMILALLPDLIITTTVDGEITFCSDQVERVLNYKKEELLGAKLNSLLVPSSRDAWKCLVQEMVNPNVAVAGDAGPGDRATKRARTAATSSDAANLRGGRPREKTGTGGGIESSDNSNGGGNRSNGGGSGGSGSGSAGQQSASSANTQLGAAIVSEQSFPMSVVNVDSKQQAAQQVSRDPRDPIAAPSAAENLQTSIDSGNSGGSGEEEAIDEAAETSGEKHSKKESTNKKRPRGDDKSSLSSDSKNSTSADDNLDRNVRWHNHCMLEGSKKCNSNDGPKDDVTGASVTANNASARLSSLQHKPEMAQPEKDDEKASCFESNGDQSSSDDSLLAGVEEKKKREGNTSDDSGYRESNDSREETSSSGSDTSQSNDRRKKPLAPTCRLCLIRDDLTTILCEVTSSVRTRFSDEEETIDEKSPGSGNSDTAASNQDQQRQAAEKELLLCLRPIREGDKVDESLRFVPHMTPVQKLFEFAETQISMTSGTESNSVQVQVDSSVRSNPKSPANNAPTSKRPPKKRAMEAFESASATKKAKTTPISSGRASNLSSTETESSVVESLMLMNKSSQ